MPLFEVLPAEARNFPFIGYIETSFPSPRAGPGGLEIGTGTLIAPRVVLTAAHMVHDSEQGGQAISVDIVFGGSQGLACRLLTQVDCAPEWRAPRSSLDTSLVSPVDVGVVILPEPIDRYVTPIPFQTSSDGMLTGMLLNVGGYPAFPPDGPRGTLWGNDFNILQGGSLTDYQGFRLFYPVRTLVGMSGGPVYDFDSVSKVRTVRGIHTSFVDEIGSSALRINEDIFQRIQQWVAAFRP